MTQDPLDRTAAREARRRDSAHDRRQRRLLLGLALLFFLPLAASFYLYYGHTEWRPGGRVNHGDLIDPPRPLPELALMPAGSADANSIAPGAGRPNPASAAYLKNKWTLLYWGSGTCAARCRVNLYRTRQVRVALDRDMDRVQRVFIAEGDCCDWSFLHEQHADLITVRATPATAALLDRIPGYDGVSPAAAERIYLIDPLGNLMMSYAPEAEPKGMLEDMKRLLRLSHVG